MATICAVADLHGNLPEELPGADVLVLAGDLCPVYDHDLRFQARWLERELYPWMERMPHLEIVWIAGNHDFVCELRDWEPGGRGRYLRDQGATVAGVSFFGTPWVPTLRNWAFYATDEELASRAVAIPAVDVVISHGPPLGHGDRVHDGRRAGSRPLTERLTTTEPALCITGHIHEDHGRSKLGPTTIANVAWVDEYYRPRPDAAMSFEL